jgi:hypothetical protein
VALEALALEGYCTESLPESAARQMPAVETYREVHAFLKNHCIFRFCYLADLKQDQVTAQKIHGRR